MVNVYVINPDTFAVEGVIDSYVSLIWRPAYSQIGDFELYAGATNEVIALLQPNRYLVRDKDISVDKKGTVTYKKVMIVKNIQLITDVENGDYLTITGRELKFILHQRIVWGQAIFYNNTAELVIRKLVGLNAINPINTARTIPNMQLAALAGFPETTDIQISNVPLDEAIIEICNTYNMGWDIYISDNKLTVEVYRGTDRSYNQSDNPYVVFSDDFENLYSTEYLYESENYANMTLVGGEGEGLSRKYTEINSDVSGLDRYEVFTDARDLSQNLESEEPIGFEDYELLLQERGRENLAAYTAVEGFTGEILADVAYKYGEDFFMGDTVTVINGCGIRKNVRVVSLIESEDADGTKLVPLFNI